MSILVTVSVNLADSVTLRDLRQFVEAAERNGADPDLDLREYDDNDDLVGLSAVGEVEAVEADAEGVDEEGDVDEADDEEGDVTRRVTRRATSTRRVTRRATSTRRVTRRARSTKSHRPPVSPIGRAETSPGHIGVSARGGRHRSCRVVRPARLMARRPRLALHESPISPLSPGHPLPRMEQSIRDKVVDHHPVSSSRTAVRTLSVYELEQ